MSNIDYLAITASGEDQVGLVQRFTSRIAEAHTYMEEAHVLADRVVEGELDPRRADVKIKLSQWSAARTQAYQEKRSIEHTVVHKLDLDDLKARLGQLVDVASTRTIEGELVHSG